METIKTILPKRKEPFTKELLPRLQKLRSLFFLFFIITTIAKVIVTNLLKVSGAEIITGIVGILSLAIWIFYLIFLFKICHIIYEYGWHWGLLILYIIGIFFWLATLGSFIISIIILLDSEKVIKCLSKGVV